LDFNMIL